MSPDCNSELLKNKYRNGALVIYTTTGIVYINNAVVKILNILTEVQHFQLPFETD